MATINLYLDTRRLRKDKTAPLKIRVNCPRTIYIPLDVYVLPENYIDNLIYPIKINRATNERIDTILYETKQRLTELGRSGTLRTLSSAQIREYLQYGPQSPRIVSVGSRFKKYMDGLTNPKTREIYQSTLNRIKDYEDPDKLTFDQINKTWLKEWVKHLSKTSKSANGRSIHLRNLRAVFNDAIDDGAVSLAIYPFRGYRIETIETEHRDLTTDQLKAIRDTAWKVGKRENLKESADCFMLSFYLSGINIVDLLRIESIQNGRISFNRAKTGRLYSIEIPAEALSLIEKYKGEKKLLTWSERHSDYTLFRKRLNVRLSKIGKEIGCPKLTYYYARHTLATIAADLDIPDDTIKMILGHGKKTETDIYIRRNRKKADEAIRKVLDHIK